MAFMEGINEEKVAELARQAMRGRVRAEIHHESSAATKSYLSRLTNRLASRVQPLVSATRQLALAARRSLS